MDGIGVEEAAAVVADQLDGFLTGDWPQDDDLLCAFDVVASTEALSVSGTPSAAKRSATTIDSGRNT